VVFVSTPNGATTYVRGVGTSLGVASLEPPFSVYVDGFYYPFFDSGLMNFSNISRLEVLLGPQSTLFGRNATAGVLQVVT
jgi:iron complex outermembrane receptor protein